MSIVPVARFSRAKRAAFSDQNKNKNWRALIYAAQFANAFEVIGQFTSSRDLFRL
jgi:hypothetical protein